MIKRLLIRLKAKKEEKVLKENKQKEKKERLKKDTSYTVSENANPDNILIDTCALNSKEGIKVIDESLKVNVLYSVIEEMDNIKSKKTRKKYKSRQEINLISNISKYSKEMMEKPKYNLIEYCYDRKEGYVDNIILNYLKKIPKRKRPTLLTADTLLAVKARCLKIEVILINAEQNKKTKNNAEAKQKAAKSIQSKPEVKKNLNENKVKKQTPEEKENKTTLNILGKVISYTQDSVKIKSYCRDSIMFIVNAEKCEELNSNVENIIETHFDYFVVIKYMPKYKMVRIVKVIIRKDIKEEVYDCKFVNEIYKLPIHENVLEKAKINLKV